ncbi:DUF1501 domain-containing protein [Thermostilla marina]
MLIRRRNFLKAISTGTAVAAIGGSVPRFLAEAADATAEDNGRVLVVLQLSGGNDGLNTVVPYEDDLYARARPTLRLTKKDVLPLEPGTGLHPAMPEFAKLYEEGVLEIVQSVGYPNPAQDHGRAKRVWETAAPETTTCPTGWVGRAADVVIASDRGRTPSVFVGKIPKPFALNAEHAVVPRIPGREWTGSLGSAVHDSALRDAVKKTLSLSRENESTERLRQITGNALERLEKVAATSSHAGFSRYPDFRLAKDLETVARLIRAEAGIRIYYVELGGGEIGGFDTHAVQAANHGALLAQMSQSIAAFVADLKRDGLLDRVALVTFSEFGRTIEENGRRGTNHGAAAPHFIVGGKVKGGILGSAPNLASPEKGGVPYAIDFRAFYATCLESWLGCPAETVLGSRYPLQPFFRV